jgi:hypothetical protein
MYGRDVAEKNSDCRLGPYANSTGCELASVNSKDSTLVNNAVMAPILSIRISRKGAMLDGRPCSVKQRKRTEKT